jgi:hypothetical protein
VVGGRVGGSWHESGEVRRTDLRGRGVMRGQTCGWLGRSVGLFRV